LGWEQIRTHSSIRHCLRTGSENLAADLCLNYLNFSVSRPLNSRGEPTCVPLKTDSKLYKYSSFVRFCTSNWRFIDTRSFCIRSAPTEKSRIVRGRTRPR